MKAFLNWLWHDWEIPLAVGALIGLMFVIDWNGTALVSQGDRDAWIVIHCDQPRLILFIDYDGNMTSNEVTTMETFHTFEPRIDGASRQYLVMLNSDCAVAPRHLSSK